MDRIADSGFQPPSSVAHRPPSCPRRQSQARLARADADGGPSDFHDLVSVRMSVHAVHSGQCRVRLERPDRELHHFELEPGYAWHGRPAQRSLMHVRALLDELTRSRMVCGGSTCSGTESHHAGVGLSHPCSWKR
jgi:hypothetical protein